MMDDGNLSTAHFQTFATSNSGKFSAAIWSAGNVPRITNLSKKSYIFDCFFKLLSDAQSSRVARSIERGSRNEVPSID